MVGKVRFAVAVLTLFCATTTPPQPLRSSGSLNSSIIVTEDLPDTSDGCDAISIFDAGSLEAQHRGATRSSPGRLAASPDLSIVLASSSNGWARRGPDSRLEPAIYFAESRDADHAAWTSGAMLGANFANQGGVAVLPDGGSFLVATSASFTLNMTAGGFRPNPPFRIAKFRFPSSGTHVRSVSGGRYSPQLEGLPVEILIDPSGELAHVYTMDSLLYRLSYQTMETIGKPVQVQPPIGVPDSFLRTLSDRIHALQTPDGRYFVSNQWESNRLNVVDLVDRRSWQVELGPDIGTVGGIAISRAAVNHEILAAHTGSKIVLYRWDPVGPLIPLGEFDLGGAPRRVAMAGPYWSIAWTESGEDVVAAVDTRWGEFEVVTVLDDGLRMEHRAFLEACPHQFNIGNDVLTRNSMLPTYTPTPAPTATHTASSTPTAVSTVPTLVPPTATVAPSATPSATSIPTTAATSTPTPGSVFLPILLRESCTPAQQRTDVALVVDASTSMLDPTAAGRPKLDAAIAAAGTFLDQLQLDAGDQASIVSFNADATLRAELTTDRASLDAALASITPASQTCLVCGVDAGADELASSRRRADNTPLLIVLTDGLSNPRPASEAVERAAEAKAAGVVIHTIGLGDTLDFDALEAMATEPDDFHRAPDGEDLAAIYAQIAVEIPCPPSRWWGRR